MTGERISELTTSQDPKTQGLIQGLRQVVDKAEADLVNIRERMASQEGIKAGAIATANTIQGMITPVQKAVQAEKMTVEEAKIRRDVILAAKEIAIRVAEEGARESVMLKGEARALLRHVEMIRTMYQASLDEERRKQNLVREMDEERAQRSAPKQMRKKKERKVEEVSKQESTPTASEPTVSESEVVGGKNT